LPCGGRGNRGGRRAAEPDRSRIGLNPALGAEDALRFGEKLLGAPDDAASQLEIAIGDMEQAAAFSDEFARVLNLLFERNNWNSCCLRLGRRHDPAPESGLTCYASVKFALIACALQLPTPMLANRSGGVPMVSGKFSPQADS